MDLDDLVTRTVAHDQAAWRELLVRITPSIQAIAGAHALLRKTGSSSRADDVAEVTAALFARLARDDFKNLHSYLTQRTRDAPQTFESWLYGALDFTIRDHVRARFGRVPRNLAQSSLPRPSKRDLNTQAGVFEEEHFRLSLAACFGVTTQLELAKIMQYVEAHFSAEEQLAMQLRYGADKSLAEIAAELNLRDEESADKLIRKLNARLRHHFAELS
ncbi:MAG: hypothetical protein JWN48_5637 [Myxococcaceae bacterium]|nr:hypothetical protein [Myxococcaceae bacterium]